MMRTVLLISGAVVALLAPTFTHAAELSAPTSPNPDVAGAGAATATPDITVVANRSQQALDKIGQSVTVLTLPQIRSDQELTVSDILARTPGISYARNGGVGQTTSIFIRGAETDQTVVLIDGIQLNDPSAPGGGFDFSNLLVSDIARIEVLRGPQSTLHGSQAIGGVVNIVSAAPTRPFQGDAQIEGGSYATGYAKLGLGGRDGPWSWRVAANSYTTTGVSAFDRRLGGKEADGYRNQGLSGRVSYSFTPDVSLDVRGLFLQSRAKFDGFSTPTYSFGDDGEFGATRESIAYGGLNFGLWDGRLKNRVAAQYTLIQRDYYDPADAPVAKTFDGRGTNGRLEYEGTFALTDGWQAVFGAQSARESITSSSPAFDAPGGAPTKAHDTLNSAYGQLQAEVAPGLNLTGGLRHDDHSTFGGRTTGQASAAWSLNGGATVLRASWGQGFKAPTVYQLFSDYGNASLRPEAAEGWDAGIQQRFWRGRIEVQATYFSRDTTNLIDFSFCSSPAAPHCAKGNFGFYDNVERARARGVELSTVVRPLPGLELTANYTHLDDRNRSPGPNFNKVLIRRPADSANGTASYTWPIKLTTTVAIRYAGGTFNEAENLTRLKGYTLADVRASYPLRRGLEVYGRVENLFDTAYETVDRYGTLGRAGSIGLRAEF